MIARREILEPQGVCHPCRAYSYLALAFLVHNIEELAGLPGWLAGLPRSVAISEPQYGRAAIGLMLAAMAVLLVGRVLTNRAVQIAVAAVAGALLANVVSHLALSLASRSVMPGTLSGLALVLPAGLWLLRTMPLAPRARWIGAGAGALAMAPVTWLALWLAA